VSLKNHQRVTKLKLRQIKLSVLTSGEIQVQATTLKETSKFLQTSRQYLTGEDQALRKVEVRLARDQYEIIEAQKLRYQVFTNDFGARIYSDEQRDIDEFDPYCKHLIALCDDKVVGCYRILFPEGARQTGRLYAETEFDLAAFAGMRQSVIELGRSCVHPDFRNGQVIRRLWTGLADLLSSRPERHVIGCVSVAMFDGGYLAANLYKQLEKEAKCHREFKVFPLDAIPLIETLQDHCKVVVPSIMQSYLKLGAKLLGEPHWDTAFNVADFPMIAGTTEVEYRFRNQQLN
jgi:putative hemolysin